MNVLGSRQKKNNTVICCMFWTQDKRAMYVMEFRNSGQTKIMYDNFEVRELALRIWDFKIISPTKNNYIGPYRRAV